MHQKKMALFEKKRTNGSIDKFEKVDFNLTGMGEMVELPGLMNILRQVINSQVRHCSFLAVSKIMLLSELSRLITVVNDMNEFIQISALCVVPNEIVVPLAPDVDVTQLFFPEPNVSYSIFFLRSTFHFVKSTSL